jgi:hypothetical protein
MENVRPNRRDSFSYRHDSGRRLENPENIRKKGIMKRVNLDSVIPTIRQKR